MKLDLKLTKEKLERFVALQNERGGEGFGHAFLASAEDAGFMPSALGLLLPWGQGGMFWQLGFCDLMTDGEGHWWLTDS